MKTVEEAIRDKILYIGEEIPEALAKDKRSKFIILGTPQELIDEVKEPSNRTCVKCQQSYHSCGPQKSNVLCPSCRLRRKSTDAVRRWMERHKDEVKTCVDCGAKINIKSKRCYKCKLLSTPTDKKEEDNE